MCKLLQVTVLSNSGTGTFLSGILGSPRYTINKRVKPYSKIRVSVSPSPEPISYLMCTQAAIQACTLPVSLHTVGTRHHGSNDCYSIFPLMIFLNIIGASPMAVQSKF